MILKIRAAAFLAVVAALLVAPCVASAQVIPPARGGTGTSTPPSYGQVLVGNSHSGYDLISTSSLGYAPATSGSSILKGNGSGGFSSAIAGADYLAPISGSTGQVPYFSASNTLSATSSIFIAASGKVGVGTTSPMAALAVGSGQVAFPDATTAAPSLAFITDLTDGFSHNSGSNAIDLSFDGAAYERFSTSGLGMRLGTVVGWSNGVPGTNDTGLSRLSAGTVAVGTGANGSTAGTLIANSIGIGTTSPNSKLEVNGNVAIGANTLLFGTSGSEDVGIIRTSTNVLALTRGTAALPGSGYGSLSVGTIYTRNTSGNQRARFTDAGFQVAQDGYINFTNGSQSSDTPDVGFSRGGAGKLYVGNGTQGDTSGTLVAATIGIGTASPADKLNVSGGRVRIGSLSTAAAANWVGSDSLAVSYNAAGAGLMVENRLASNDATNGAGFVAYANPGVSMANGARLGFNLFGGSTSATSVANSGGITAYADGAWSGTSAPTRLAIELAPAGSTSRTEVLTIKSDGKVGIGTTTPSTLLNIYGGGLGVNPGATAKPTCSLATRGMIWNTFGAAGVADTFQVCQKDAADAYSWVTK